MARVAEVFTDKVDGLTQSVRVKVANSDQAVERPIHKLVILVKAITGGLVMNLYVFISSMN